MSKKPKCQVCSKKVPAGPAMCGECCPWEVPEKLERGAPYKRVTVTLPDWVKDTIRETARRLTIKAGKRISMSDVGRDWLRRAVDDVQKGKAQ